MCGNSNKWYMSFDKSCQSYIQQMILYRLVHGKSYVSVNIDGNYGQKSVFHLPKVSNN